MANHVSLSHAQVRALDKLFKKHGVGDSADALVADFGTEDGVRLYQLAERVASKAEEGDSK